MTEYSDWYRRCLKASTTSNEIFERDIVLLEAARRIFKKLEVNGLYRS